MSPASSKYRSVSGQYCLFVPLCPPTRANLTYMSSLGLRPSTTKPEKETRLALVLNGGVSSAVWMGGVVYELDRLRRDDSAQDIREEDRPLFSHGVLS